MSLRMEELYPLTDSGLTGKELKAARGICLLWRNSNWMKQEPLPACSPVSCRSSITYVAIRKLATLTPVGPSDPIPDGFPSIVLKVLQRAILEDRVISKKKTPQGRWSQRRIIPAAIELLKNELGKQEEGSNSKDGQSGSGENQFASASSMPVKMSKKKLNESLILNEEDNDGSGRGEHWGTRRMEKAL